MQQAKWYTKSLRRHLFDMHIADWDEKFLSKFDARVLADNLAIERCTSVVAFANTHTGLCNYPTKVGQVHRGLKGRDALKEMIDAFHRRGLDVIVYYCMIYTDWYYDTFPQARFVDVNGRSDKTKLEGKAGAPGRLSTSCPNNKGYRDFVVAQLTELCEGYDFEGVWLDMTFWPGACYCATCEERYILETGEPIPRVINWTDPSWTRFHRKRQRWLVEYADLVSSTVRKGKPGATVVHQSGAFVGDWTSGVSLDLATCTDWLSADLYRDRDDQAVYSKMFYGLSSIKPFEHIHCWYFPGIFEHVVPQTEHYLRCTAFSALMNHGATVFIDAIDPVGTVNANNYRTSGKVFSELKKYEPFAGGTFCQDFGIYLNFDSLVDLPSGKNNVLVSKSKHKNAIVEAGKVLLENHLPFGVITKYDLGKLDAYQVVMLPNVAVLATEEIDAFREYVRKGGSLYASKNTSLLSFDGVKQNDFMLSDLFGVSYEGETDEIVTYVSPNKKHAEVFSPYTAPYPATLQDSQTKVKLTGNAQVLATVTLPYTDPCGTLCASSISDPPGIATTYPSIVLNKYGKGRVLYAAGPVEIWEHESLRKILGRLLRLLATRPFHFETTAPRPVEITLFEQENGCRFIINVLNNQKELPNIPVEGINVRVWLGQKRARSLRLLPQGKRVAFTRKKGAVEFVVPRLETFAMLELRYEIE